jgi:hypothetical protein
MRAHANPGSSPDENPDTDDLGYRDDQEERAYERAQSEDQPQVSPDPESDAEPADAG